MRGRPLARGIASVVISAGVLFAALTPAGADAVYPSAHIPLHPLGDAPLTSGFVENIHANGPNVFAHELYVVNGALANTGFQVSIAVSVGDTTCSAPPVSFETATLQTNAAGNGFADVVFTPEDADGLRNGTHGAIWTLSVDGTAVYQTDCAPIVLD
jgi:hypothetical protein